MDPDTMRHPYAELIGMELVEQRDGEAVCAIDVTDELMNPQEVVHGAVLYGLADTAMGAALYPSLGDRELCATIEIKISYLRYVVEGRLSARAKVLHRGRSVALLEADILNDDQLVARATGSFAIFQPTRRR